MVSYKKIIYFWQVFYFSSENIVIESKKVIEIKITSCTFLCTAISK